jgi:ribosomal protein S18 acetylase RimI-like enzyme
MHINAEAGSTPIWDPHMLFRIMRRTMMQVTASSARGIIRAYPGSALALTCEPVADLNYVVIDDMPDAEDRLREFHAIIGELALPAIVFLAPSVNEYLAPIAASLGLQFVGAAPFMAHEPVEMPRPSDRFQVTIVRDAKDLQAVVDITVAAYRMPKESASRVLGPEVLLSSGVDIFLARRDGVPIGSGITFQNGPIVGVYSMATSPDQQRQGAGRAVMDALTAHHMERGAKVFYLGATEEGYHLYEQIGYRVALEVPTWVIGHSMQFS